MDDLSDYHIEHIDIGPGRVAATPSRPIALWMAVACGIAAIGTAAYFAFGTRFTSTAQPSSNGTTFDRTLPAAESLGGPSDASRLPPLGETDALVRQLVQALSRSPAVAAWLATDNLVRNFTVVVVNVAEGATPAKRLPTLRPTAHFVVQERDGSTFVDPRSYARYGAITEAVSSLDPAGAAGIYTTLKPRIEDAYRELGFPRESFDRALERAIVAVLNVPIVDRPVRLRAKGIGYAFADERLEDLSHAQKQLLRIGPQNLRIVQEKVRAIALALGIRADSLPPAQR
jgi:DUF3014 family protein